MEQRPSVVDGTTIPLDLKEPNPNGVEYDNLYIDMNGLIHPCSHPENREGPSTETEMYINVAKYLDRLFTAIRPRRLLYLAIDGVAPRAKMNQQRSRRFRAAKEAREKNEMMKEVLREMEELGMDVLESPTPWDSNVITPGTEFMHRLSLYVWYYILERVNRDPAWQNIKVIFSDASEPGEGEHKIMQFIRSQRTYEGYDPNQRHILHGLDADLIMLALATHEPHFTILREEVSFGGPKDPSKNNKKSDGQKMLDSQRIVSNSYNTQDEWVYEKPLNTLKINVLRDYLTGEFSCLHGKIPFKFDIERIIDDFVFICFFVGNDFLPHLPSLDLRDGAIDFLIEIYKEILPSIGDYLTSPGGNVNLRQVDVILGKVGEIEDEVFRQRKQMEDNIERRIQHSKLVKSLGGAGKIEADAIKQHAMQNQLITPINSGDIVSKESGGTAVSLDVMKDQLSQMLKNNSTGSTESNATNVSNKVAASTIRETILGKRSKNDSLAAPVAPDISQEPDSKRQAKVLRTDEDNDQLAVVNEIEDGYNSESDEDVGGAPSTALETKTKSLSEEESGKIKSEIKSRIKNKEQSIIDRFKESLEDTVRLHEGGWKERYYNDKFKKKNIEEGGGVGNMCYQYIKGLCWVLKYYYVGCPSWNWYYPFHYAPFASDLVNIDKYSIEFELAQPFRPFEQLLAVFPRESMHALPIPAHYFMSDPASPIYDLYNNDDIPIDPNGKKIPHQWILLLPFIDESRITSVFESCKDKLSFDERMRNARGKPLIIMHRKNKLVTDKLKETAFVYAPGTEEDAEVIAALELMRAQTTSDTSVDASQSRIEYEVKSVDFNGFEGDGIGGTLSRAAPRHFSSLDACIQAPESPSRFFSNITSNQVLCFNINYTPKIEHQSLLLPGVALEKSILTNYDLTPKKPPRLNRGGFNLLDLKNKNSRSNHYGNDYSDQRHQNQHQQYQHNNNNNNNNSYHTQQQQYLYQQPYSHQQQLQNRNNNHLPYNQQQKQQYPPQQYYQQHQQYYPQHQYNHNQQQQYPPQNSPQLYYPQHQYPPQQYHQQQYHHQVPYAGYPQQAFQQARAPRSSQNFHVPHQANYSSFQQNARAVTPGLQPPVASMSAMRTQAISAHSQHQKNDSSSTSTTKSSITGNVIDPRKMARPPSQTKKKL